MPFLSVLLPTKNRSHLVHYAIQSVLQQDFDDFEIIVCDNDDSDMATRLVVQKFDDNRIKYIRTGGIGMVENWNRALDTATGDYVTVLEDKMIFYPNALPEIKNKIEQSPSGVVVWHSDVLDDNFVPARLIQLVPSGQSTVSSDKILKLVTTDVMKHWVALPRGLSCVVPRSIIFDITKKTNSKFYEPLSPDFVSAVKVLANVDEVLAVYQAYTLVASGKTSNGRNIQVNKKDALKYYSGKSTVNLKYDFVPVKNTLIVVNSIINDYRRIASKDGGKIKGHHITNKSYVKMMTRELLINTVVIKKILWSKRDLWQLITSNSQSLRNLLYMTSYCSTLMVEQVLKKLGFVESAKKNTVLNINSDPLDSIKLFLEGKANLGSKKCFQRSKIKAN